MAITSSTQSSEHIHFGAGSFGLGMVVELCHRQAGLETTVLSRYSNKPYQNILKRVGEYSVTFDNNSAQRNILKPQIEYYTEGQTEGAVAMLANPSVSLITCSVKKDNIDAIAAILAHGLRQRWVHGIKGNVCVMACENMPQNSTELQTRVLAKMNSDEYEHLLAEVFFCNTLVDRVCAPIIAADDSVNIPTESFHSWIVHAPPTYIPVLRRLREKGVIEIADDETEFRAHEIQKYWCLNGAHLAAAAYAYNHRKDWRHFSQALSSPAMARKIKALQEELGLAFVLYISRSGLQNKFSISMVEQYNKNVFRRLRRNNTDTIGRVLKLEQRSPDAILEVLDRIERLVAPQCEILAARKKLLTPRYDVLALHPSPPVSSTDRLELDDAVQQVVLAMRDFDIAYRASVRRTP
jgi:mannitol-1-phosphate/altronate dehydrogenase